MTGDLQVPLKVLGENTPRFESIRRRTQFQLPDRLLTIVRFRPEADIRQRTEPR